jgi:hypothetical protein
MISSFCEEEIEAVLLAMASFFPNFILAGIMMRICDQSNNAVHFMRAAIACYAINTNIWFLFYRNVVANRR